MRFNPRAHEGHDLIENHNLSWLGCFNPRAHEGHDTSLSIAGNARVKVSIHVPTRGTTYCGVFLDMGLGFQSTCPRGARRF